MDKYSTCGHKYSAEIKRVISLAFGNKVTNQVISKEYLSHSND